MKIKLVLHIVLVIILIIFFGLLGYYLYTTQQVKAGSNLSQVVSAPVVQPESFAQSNIKPVVEDKTIRILAVGDTGLLEPLGSKVVNTKYDPLVNVRDYFKKYDYVVANMEATIDGASVGSPTPGKPYTFSTPKISVDIFKNAGIGAMSLANNHTKDYGPKSVTHTIDLLNKAGIGTFGAGANNAAAYTPLVVNIKGTKIAFLGYDSAEYDFNHATDSQPGTASFVESRVRASIEKARSLADIVIVYTHWGVEHTQNLDPIWQVQWAKIITSAGADIIIGGHPHVVQQQATVNGKPVFYSIGNFMYPGQAGDPNALKGGAVEIDIKDKKITSTKLHHVQMSIDGIPSITD